MSDQISTLPLVIWQPSRRARFARQIFIKSRNLGMTEYQKQRTGSKLPSKRTVPR